MVLDNELLAGVKEALNQKYKLVKDSLLREYPGTSFPYMLWEQGSSFMELQKLSVHIIRLVYVNKTVYENYREFFYKTFGIFRPPQKSTPWLKDLKRQDKKTGAVAETSYRKFEHFLGVK